MNAQKCRWTLVNSLQQVLAASPRDPDTLVCVDVDEVLVVTPLERREYSRLIDPQSPQHIEAFKKTYQYVIAFTAAAGRDPTNPSEQMPDIRFQHLRSLGITFNEEAPLRLSKHPIYSTSAVYEKGILYSDQRDKGEILREFLPTIGWKVSHIVLVDDNWVNLSSVEQAAADLQTPFTGFLYRPPKPSFLPLQSTSNEIDPLLEHALQHPQDWET